MTEDVKEEKKEFTCPEPETCEMRNLCAVSKELQPDAPADQVCEHMKRFVAFRDVFKKAQEKMEGTDSIVLLCFNLLTMIQELQLQVYQLDMITAPLRRMQAAGIHEAMAAMKGGEGNA